MHDLSETIVAIATPPGRGGVGCVRLSGPDSETISGRLVRSGVARLAAKDLVGSALTPPKFVAFVDREKNALDHGFLMIFPEGRSFTGELTAELWPHGSPVVLGALLEAAVAAGAVLAGPGEFTYRALRSGRLDLARAEAIRDLVDARSVYQAQVAFRQAEGSLSRRLEPLRELLAVLIARGEAAVEFVEESEVHLAHGVMEAGIDEIRDACTKLHNDFAVGRVVREGASIALIGIPNAGKSSLFNAWLAEERAIVTEVPGTTRDLLEETAHLDGVPLRWIDCAGLRETKEPIEREGVERAQRAQAEADRVLLLLDGSRKSLDRSERIALKKLADPAERIRTIVVWNKTDLVNTTHKAFRKKEMAALLSTIKVSSREISTAPWISAKTGKGLEKLRDRLRKSLFGGPITEDPQVTHARHAEALEAAGTALARAADALPKGITEEFVLEDLREAMEHLGRIVGAFGVEELYDRVFSTFCIGK